MSHTINDLRTVLFDTLQDLRNKDNPMDIERARAINDTAQTIINTAKVEVDHIRVVGSGCTDFIPRATPPTTPALPNGGATPALPTPAGDGEAAAGTTVENIAGGRRITHRLA